MKKFKSRLIYLLSSLPSDEILDKIKPKRIKLEDSLHTDPRKVQEFKESECIFDDIDVISNKKRREAMSNILNQILEIGRRFKIHCSIMTNHLPTNGKGRSPNPQRGAYRHVLPHSAGSIIKYRLEEYVGLDTKQIAYMKRQRSRACTIFKNYPQCYLLQNEIGLLDLDHDEQPPERA